MQKTIGEQLGDCRRVIKAQQSRINAIQFRLNLIKKYVEQHGDALPPEFKAVFAKRECNLCSAGKATGWLCSECGKVLL